MRICESCILPDSYPNIEFDEKGVCNFCKKSDINTVKNRHEIGHIEKEEDLIKKIQALKDHENKYDVLVPISGGVDSSNALIHIVEKFNLRPLAYHNDHGYEDETATNNVKKLCKQLGVDLVIMQQDINFMKKLWKYMNETYAHGLSTCYVCGNILYLNAIELADKFGIRIIINGYSKGQSAMVNDASGGLNLLEQQLEVIRKSKDKEFLNEFMKKYKCLDKKLNYSSKIDLEDKIPSGKILIIPFYIFPFYKTEKDVLKKRLMEQFDWKPTNTSYPKRTTNCEMIWLNTYMDYKKMNYSMYHEEYAQLVRSGEMTREQALSDLEFNPPEGIVQRLAAEIEVDINKFSENKIVKEKQEKKITVDFDF